ADNRLEFIAQPKSLAQGFLIFILGVQRLSSISPRNMAVQLRIPNVVINPIEDSANFIAVHLQPVGQAVVVSLVHYFPGVMRRNRRDEVRIYDAPFHHVNARMVEIILEAIVMKKVRVPIESGPAEDMLASHSLMLKIVQRVTNPRMPHSQVLINLVEQN